jgi:hypothetical protein
MPGSKRARLLAATSAIALMPPGAAALPFHDDRPDPAPRVVELGSASLAAATLPPEAPLLLPPAPPPPPPPPPARAAAPARVATTVRAEPTDANFDRLAQCESNGRWNLASGNGYYGGLQFLVSTWHSLGGTGLPSDHPREVQIALARKEWQRSGWSAWPSCSRQLGFR